MKIRNILFFVSAICLMASCSDLFNVDHIGEAIQFGVSSGSKELSTRTEYAKSEGVFNGKERLNWTADDKVYIWMYWDEDRNGSYESGPSSAEYKVGLKTNSKEKSYGSLISTGTSLRWKGDFSGNDGRAHEYKHAFYSVYPSTWREFNGNNVKFNIPNSQKGVDMSLAYMTAYKDNVTSLRDDNNPNKYVDLEYYPRVTTLYITVVNDTDEAVGGEIKLSSSNSPITGDYFVSIPDYSSGESGNNYEGGKEVTNTIKSLAKNASDIVAFFIRPRNYDSGELSLTFNGKTQSLNKALKPNLKYNIKIKVSKSEPEIEEPEPLPPLSAFVNGVIAAEAHKRGLNWQFGEASKGEDPNKLYCTHPDKNNAWEPVPDDKLLEIIESIVDLKLTSTWEAKEITADDLNIFPNLRTVDIDASNLESIEVKNPNITSLKISSQSLKHVSVENCDGLTTFTVYSQMNLRSVTVRNNAKLKDFTVEGSNNFSDTIFTIICDSCPELTTFTWKGGDGWGIRYHKEITECPKFGKPTTPSGSKEE